MALAFETMAAEQQETARLATTRQRDTWKKDTVLERHLHSTAEVTAVTRTELEDAVVAAGLLPEEDITKVAKLRAGRRAWTRMDNMYKRLEVATKFGLTAAELGLSISSIFLFSRNTKMMRNRNCFAEFRLFREIKKKAKFRFALFRRTKILEISKIFSQKR